MLHTAAVNEATEVAANRYYIPSFANPLNPDTFVHKIHVPVFLACQWTDEQTGAHCPELAEHFSGTRLKWFTFTNGAHIDSLDPATAVRWYDFLTLFVAHRLPVLSPDVKALAPLLYETAMGIGGITFPADPIEDEPDYASALAAFERLPSVRILFDNGAGSSTPRAPVDAFEQSFSRFPLPGTRAASWYLGSRGALQGSPRASGAVDAFTWSPRARPLTDFTGNTGPGGLWGTSPDYHWTQNPAGTALSYVTAPLTQNTVVVGAGALHAWIEVTAPDVDLQVTVSEVRPDGNETFVQSGWLDASERKLSAQSTLLEPLLTELQDRREAAAEGTVHRGGRAALLRGSRVPGGIADSDHDLGPRRRSAHAGRSRIWCRRDSATVRIAHSPAMPSRIILPVIPGVAVPTSLPSCQSLRGEPCRRYAPLATEPNRRRLTEAEQPLEHARDTRILVRRGHLVRRGDHVGVRVGDRDRMARPGEHRQVVGHVAERDHVLAVDPALVAQPGQRRGLADAGRTDLEQAVGRVRVAELRQLRSHFPRPGKQHVGRKVVVAQHQLDRRLRHQRLDDVNHRVIRDRPARDIAGLVSVAAVPLDGPRAAGHLGLQQRHQLPGDRGLERRGLEDRLGVEIEHHRAVCADRHAAVAGGLRQGLQPARGAGGAEQHDRAGGLGAGDRRRERSSNVRRA